MTVRSLTYILINMKKKQVLMIHPQEKRPLYEAVFSLFYIENLPVACAEELLQQNDLIVTTDGLLIKSNEYELVKK